MESSSEDSFAWTNTTSDKSESEAMAQEEESDFDKHYKKKLQKELFQNGNLNNSQEETPRRKKKKIKREESPAAPVKQESDSDSRLNGAAAVERCLRLKVKEEQASVLAPRKRRRSSGSDTADTARDADARPHKKKKAKREHRASSRDETDAGEPPPKKKKKHKRASVETNSNEPIIDKFEAEETIVETRRAAAPVAKCSIPIEKPFTSKEFVDTDSDSDDESRPPAQVYSEKCDIEIAARSPEPSPKRSIKIRERITYEEEWQDRLEPESEDESPPQPQSESPPENPGAPAGRLARFLRAHAHLKPAEGRPGAGAALGADDDVWLVRAPHSLDAAALAGAALALDARCKLKAGGGAYEAAPAPCGPRAALLVRDAGWRVRGVRVRGALQLRVRVPRARVPPGAAPEGPGAVPLPATRRRHPLLGVDYERAPAPRPRARPDPDRSDAVEAPDRHEKKKKKKKEKRKREREEADAASAHAPARSPSPPLPRERPRRADPWDSAAAIEESLFNF